MPEESRGEESPGAGGWTALPNTSLHVLCLRSCSDEIGRSFLSASSRLRSLQIVDSKLQANPGVVSTHLTSLSLTGIVTMSDDQYSSMIAGCPHLRSLYISKSHISHITVSLPNLELLSVTHCRQLTDQCATELLQFINNPSLRFVDLSEDRSLTSPMIDHPIWRSRGLCTARR